MQGGSGLPAARGSAGAEALAPVRAGKQTRHGGPMQHGMTWCTALARMSGRPFNIRP